jgi:hypothetical protein
MYGMYRKLAQMNTGVLTGKNLEFGGSLIRPEATGFGALYFVKQMLETAGQDIKGKTVAISGFGNVMVYLGTFSIATMKRQRNYSYGYGRDRGSYEYATIDTTPERAFFAYEMPNGKYQINAYPITNKTVLEMYRCDDKGTHRTNEEFTSLETNLEIIHNKIYASKHSYAVQYADESEKKKYPHIEVSLGYRDFPVYIQCGKENIRKNAFEYLKGADNLQGYDKARLYETEKEFKNAYSRRL